MSVDLADFEEWMRAWGASEKTIELRVRRAKTREADWGDLTAVTPAMVRAWLARPHLSRWSQLTYYNDLNSIFEWMSSTGQIDESPMQDLRRPRTPQSLPKPLSDDEMKAALAAASEVERTWLLLAMYAGLRAHEIAKIRGEDVQEGHIFVHGKGDKDAYIPTHPALWALAQDYPRRGWWFPSKLVPGEPVAMETVSTRTARLFRSVGIPSGSIHRVRHLYATRLLRRGANIRVVQTLMRHATIATTALYCGVDEDERGAAIDLL